MTSKNRAVSANLRLFSGKECAMRHQPRTSLVRGCGLLRLHAAPPVRSAADRHADAEHHGDFSDHHDADGRGVHRRTDRRRASVIPLWGYLYDRYGRAKLLALASFIWGATTWLNAIAPTYKAFLVTRATTGIDDSSYPGLYSLISDYFGPKVRGKIYGLLRVDHAAGLPDRHDPGAVAAGCDRLARACSTSPAAWACSWRS